MKPSNVLPTISLIINAVFVAFKLTKVITWSWWWVFSPMLIPLGITFFVAVIIVAGDILERDDDVGN